MRNNELEIISAPVQKAGLFSAGYTGLLWFTDHIFSSGSFNYALISFCLFGMVLGLLQKHMIFLMLTSRKFVIRVAYCLLTSLWLFMYFDIVVMKILALAPGYYIFFSSFKFRDYG